MSRNRLNAGVASTKPTPELAQKKRPAQQRSIETCELILRVTANLLASVGIERLSTNLVCKEAGLSPPALYRYFPNKYALVNELGVRLMNRQNALIDDCITSDVLADPVNRLQPALKRLFLATHQATMETDAGVWITRAMRAVPALEAVRLVSHHAVTEQMALTLFQQHPAIEFQRLRVSVRLAVEVMYSSMEMLFDDPTLQAADVAESTAWMVYDLYDRTGVIRPWVATTDGGGLSG